MNRRDTATLLTLGALAFSLRSIVRRLREEPIEGEVAIVTGGSGGLGFAIARELARAGCTVVICAARSASSAAPPRSWRLDGRHVLGHGEHDAGRPYGDAEAAARPHRQRDVDRREGQHSAPPAVQRREVRCGWILRGTARGGRAGRHQRDDPAFFKGDVEREFSWFAVASTMPGLTVSATRAARQIVSAMRRRVAEVVIGTPAKIATKGNSLMPRTSAAGRALHQT